MEDSGIIFTYAEANLQHTGFHVRKTILKYDRIDTDSDGIFPIGITNWEVVHAKNPMLPKDKYHRTNKNLSKTRQLYPALYLATKDMDITIIYGTMPGDKTEKMKKGAI